jgi:hypothetical protein
VAAVTEVEHPGGQLSVLREVERLRTDGLGRAGSVRLREGESDKAAGALAQLLSIVHMLLIFGYVLR